MVNNINYKINIDKTKNKYYNKTKVEIFTYKEHILYEKFINERVCGLQEEAARYKRMNQNIFLNRTPNKDRLFNAIQDIRI